MRGYKVDIAHPTALSFTFDDKGRMNILAVMADKCLAYDETYG